MTCNLMYILPYIPHPTMPRQEVFTNFQKEHIYINLIYKTLIHQNFRNPCIVKGEIHLYIPAFVKLWGDNTILYIENFFYKLQIKIVYLYISL